MAVEQKLAHACVEQQLTPHMYRSCCKTTVKYHLSFLLILLHGYNAIATIGAIESIIICKDKSFVSYAYFYLGANYYG